MTFIRPVDSKRRMCLVTTGELVSTHSKVKQPLLTLNPVTYLMTVAPQCVHSGKRRVEEPALDYVTRVSFAATINVYNSIHFELILNKTRVIK